jgi:NAD-dependent SIR2 family protein deacetylase
MSMGRRGPRCRATRSDDANISPGSRTVAMTFAWDSGGSFRAATGRILRASATTPMTLARMTGEVSFASSLAASDFSSGLSTFHKRFEVVCQVSGAAVVMRREAYSPRPMASLAVPGFAAESSRAAFRDLASFITGSRSLFVLTGAGCSTAAGIPDYRDESGAWKHKPPVQYLEFVQSHSTRQRYWARSLVGWARIAAAVPARSHSALATLERLGRISCVVTQNVDGLHQKAGSASVVDLHGRLDTVRCLSCSIAIPRAEVQRSLVSSNPRWARLDAKDAPDGDAQLDGPFDDVEVPRCSACAGVLKPDVVFFGENVPKARVAHCYAALAAADRLLVVGSSLMVFSGYRFCLAAAEAGKPIAIVNRGRTRADDMASVKADGECGAILGAIADELAMA